MKLKVFLEEQEAKCKVEFVEQNASLNVFDSDVQIITKVDIPHYLDSYDVTPTFDEQTLQTKWKYMVDNVVIEPIPPVLISNVEPEYIKDGVNVKIGDSDNAGRLKDVVGTFTNHATVSSGQIAASSGEILTGYSSWVDGKEVKGSLRAMTTSEIHSAAVAGWGV